MVKLADAVITSQGQISIPKRVREKLHAKKGDKIAFYEDEKGHLNPMDCRHWVGVASALFKDKSNKDDILCFMDLMEASYILPKNVAHSFDIVFLQEIKPNMTVSYVDKAIRLVKDSGFLVLRFKASDDDADETVDLLRQALFESGYKMHVFFGDSLPGKQFGLDEFCYIIQRPQFTDVASPLTFSDHLNQVFRTEAAARLSA